jgi:endonuclease G
MMGSEDINRFWVAYTIIGVGDVIDGTENLNSFGFSALSAASDKHMIGEFANIVQHPQGRFKEIVLRENRLVNRFDDCLHYVADTEPGSSGSPVYNSEWQMIALHHWGGPWVDGGNIADPQKYEINEGIRISSIIRKLKSQIRDLPSDVQSRIGNILDSEGSFIPSPRQLLSVDKKLEESSIKLTEVKIDSDGRAVLTLPIEISFRIPSLEIELSAVTGDTSGTRK